MLLNHGNVFKKIVAALHVCKSLSTSAWQLPKDPSILIVGGGLAGLSSARYLLSKGFNNISIFEASSRVGGRINSLKFGRDNPELVIEEGAQWLHGLKTNALCPLLIQAGLLEEERLQMELKKEPVVFQDFYYFMENGEAVDQNEGKRIFQSLHALYESIFHAPKTSSHDSVGVQFENAVSEALASFKDVDKAFLTALVHAVKKYVRFTEGVENLDDLSIRGRSWFEGDVGGEMDSFLAGGLSKMMEYLTKEVGEERIHLGHEVTGLMTHEVPGLVRVRYRKVADNMEYCQDFHHVILSISLGVLKRYQHTLFTPQLPKLKVDALKEVEMGQVEKVFVELNQSVFPPGVDGRTGFAILSPREFHKSKKNEMESLLSSMGHFYSLDKSGKRFLTVFFGDGAVKVARLEWPHVQTLLEGYLKRSLKNDALRIENLQTSQWAQRPFILGSYTHAKPKARENVFHVISEPIVVNDEPKVLFAGEHTHPTLYSCMQGAYDSGLREAKRLCQLYKMCKC